MSHPITVAWLVRYLRSSVGAKHVMAITGLLLLLFAIVHMIGHLQMFGGRAVYNAYATFLQDLWEVKWPVRAGLLAVLIIHVVTAIGLVAKNRAARPKRYAMYRPVVSSIIGRTMALTGLVVLAFLVFHIWHFTISPHRPPEGFDTYGMYVHAFRNPLIYGLYLIGIAKLAAHLGHGASSWLQSLGWRHPKYPTDALGPIVAIGLFIGYMTPPTAVLLGAIQ
jgi:succinate dehydrogenase / fumarate reductase cytochrome b subunit